MPPECVYQSLGLLAERRVGVAGVPDAHRQRGRLAGAHVAGEVQLERRVTAAVLARKPAVDPDPGVPVDGAESRDTACGATSRSRRRRSWPAAYPRRSAGRSRRAGRRDGPPRPTRPAPRSRADTTPRPYSRWRPRARGGSPRGTEPRSRPRNGSAFASWRCEPTCRVRHAIPALLLARVPRVEAEPPAAVQVDPRLALEVRARMLGPWSGDSEPASARGVRG